MREFLLRRALHTVEYMEQPICDIQITQALQKRLPIVRTTSLLEARLWLDYYQPGDLTACRRKYRTTAPDIATGAKFMSLSRLRES